MKLILGLSLLVCVLFSSCSTPKVIGRNCKNISENLYECELVK